MWSCQLVIYCSYMSVSAKQPCSLTDRYSISVKICVHVWDCMFVYNFYMHIDMGYVCVGNALSSSYKETYFCVCTDGIFMHVPVWHLITFVCMCECVVDWS